MQHKTDKSKKLRSRHEKTLEKEKKTCWRHQSAAFGALNAKTTQAQKRRESKQANDCTMSNNVSVVMDPQKTTKTSMQRTHPRTEITANTKITPPITRYE
jgi:hypothetical protein